jgi:hypothetical protein
LLDFPSHEFINHRLPHRLKQKSPPKARRSDGVRDHPGMSFGIIPDSAFDFAGIPSQGGEATNLI